MACVSAALRQIKKSRVSHSDSDFSISTHCRETAADTRIISENFNKWNVSMRPVLENFLDILAARRHLAVAYSKCRSRHRARMIPRSRCRSPSMPLPRRAPRPGRRPRPTAREPMSTRRVFCPPHARVCWLRVCHRTRSTQHSYQVYQHVQKLGSRRRLSASRQAWRAGGGSAKRTFRFQCPRACRY